MRFFRRKGQAITRIQYKTNLKLSHYRDGKLLKTRDLGAGLITNAGVFVWSADWNNATATLKLANFHDSGTGTASPTTADTIMQTPTGQARVVGSQSSTNNIYQTTATISYGNTFAITEWGLFTDSITGTLFDHRTFSPVACVAGDTIQFTYQLTLVSGG